MTTEEKRIKIAQALGYRRWKFGDPWRKGIKLADGRFNGYVRRVIKDAEPDSKTVLLDIDEAWTNPSSEVVKHYTPVSHWVKDGIVTASLPDYFRDLNAMHEAEKAIPENKVPEYTIRLSGGEMSEGWPTCFLNLEAVNQAASSTSAQRAESFGKTLNLW